MRDAQATRRRLLDAAAAEFAVHGIAGARVDRIAAAAKVLTDTGNSGTVQLTGLGTPNSLRAYVKDGTIKEFALWNVQSLGYLTYYVAAKLVSGDIQGTPGESFSVPTLGDYTIGDNSVLVLGPPQVFDSNNIDQFNF